MERLASRDARPARSAQELEVIGRYDGRSQKWAEPRTLIGYRGAAGTFWMEFNDFVKYFDIVEMEKKKKK